MIDELAREIIIKEARLAALHDLEAVLRDIRAGKLIKATITDEVKGALDIIMFYLAQRVKDVARDKAGRQILSHIPWGDQEVEP